MIGLYLEIFGKPMSTGRRRPNLEEFNPHTVGTLKEMCSLGGQFPESV